MRTWLVSVSLFAYALFVHIERLLVGRNSTFGDADIDKHERYDASYDDGKRYESTVNITKLDCGMRKLAMEYAGRILRQSEGLFDDRSEKWLHEPDSDTSLILSQVSNALRLEDLCNSSMGIFSEYEGGKLFETPKNEKKNGREATRRVGSTDQTAGQVASALCSPRFTKCFFVEPAKNTIQSDTVANGSFSRPFNSIHDALEEFRRQRRLLKRQQNHKLPPSTLISKIILRQGSHTIGSLPVRLGEIDKNLIIMGFPGENVWITGGVPLTEAKWKKWEHNENVLVADLSSIFDQYDLQVPDLMSIFTTRRRYTRARYPNGDPETAQWGYASYHRLNYSIPAGHVLEWHKPPAGGKPPQFDYFDFSALPLPPGVPVKNNSAQPGYNKYASGHGGVCSEVWGDNASSYWCSNASEGGWAEVDQECAREGRIQLPIGMSYNQSTEAGKRFLSLGKYQGGIIHAWHSQSWAMHMFEISGQKKGLFSFKKGGGRQGGRNWCRCDQCSYAAQWCHQRNIDPPDEVDTRLISGSWMVENVLVELDQPGEFFFDKEMKTLYIYPNATSDLADLHMAVLENLITTTDTSNITIQNLGFRSTASTYMGEWSPPSGGDWSLHRGGAVFLENVENVTIQSCRFSRLDGNAIFLSRRVRNAVIRNNRFEWLGESAIATWGDTDKYDGRDENFPIDTLIEYNVMRELGIYQKQSSAVGQCKAARSTIRKNIMFNTPRAAINFNDMLGGGDVVEDNLIFNSCRESGDHGPINTWDRQAFLTTLRYGPGQPSFDPLPRIIRNNLIFANYGASEGVDNDDGSSWHSIHGNCFYMSDGFKMDYGGHDSVFFDNLVISYPYDEGHCFNVHPIKEDPGDAVFNNICIVGLGHKMDSGCGDPSCAYSGEEKKDYLEQIGTIGGSCSDSHLFLANNSYYTVDGRATFLCSWDQRYTLQAMQIQFGLETGSTVDKIPGAETILGWAKQKTKI